MAEHFERPLSQPIPNCPTCTHGMFRLHDIGGEYFICRNIKANCNQRISGLPYSEFYRKKFSTNDGGAIGVARAKAHGIFDVLWRKKGLTRNDAYKVLQKVMNLSEEDAHISKFSVDQCNLLIRRLNQLGDAVFILAPEEYQ
jgi:hypothetical protein